VVALDLGACSSLSRGSLRTMHGLSHDPASICPSAPPDACLVTPGEPVWLAQ
jgi:hypothetical protein